MATVHATSIEKCVKHISQRIKDDDVFHSKGLPGLPELIDDWYDPTVDVNFENFVRRFLQVFRDSVDGTYSRILGNYSSEQEQVIRRFVNEDISAEQAAKEYQYQSASAYKTREALANCLAAPPLVQPTQNGLLEPFEFSFGVVDGHTPAKNVQFENWGGTVKNTPALTFVPESTKDVQQIVRYAKQTNRGVRVSGFRHSWSPVFGRDNKFGHRSNGDILISTLGLWNASVLPNFTSIPGDWSQPDAIPLNSISVVDESWVSGLKLSGGKKYVRVGTSTTNEQLRRWCIEHGKVTLPMNIIEVEITFGGSNAPICHGAGIQNATLCDLVRCIEYVDAHGELRKVDMSEPELLKAAAGCFGLIGVVTHLTLEFEPMSCAAMTPRKIPVVFAVPPPPEMRDEDIPEVLRPKIARTAKEKQKVQDEFERLASTCFYAEWFWFPYSREVWVNCWNKEEVHGDIQPYPSNAKTILQVFGTIGMNILQNADIFLGATKFAAFEKTAFFSFVAMRNFDEVLPNEEPIHAWLPDALHFQRGVQNVRVRDMELEIPLHLKKDQPNKLDFVNAQRAWWTAITKCYEPANLEVCPMRMPLEMRIMAGSEITMAPQRGNKYGTASVEILTLHAAAVAGIWEPFAQSVLNEWMKKCGTDAAGNKLNLRPHWAKEWDPYTVSGKPWRQVLKEESYEREIKEFKALLTRLGRKHGWTLADLKRRFSNELLDYLFLDDVAVDHGRPGQGDIEVSTAKPVKESRHAHHHISEWISHLVK